MIIASNSSQHARQKLSAVISQANKLLSQTLLAVNVQLMSQHASKLLAAMQQATAMSLLVTCTMVEVNNNACAVSYSNSKLAQQHHVWQLKTHANNTCNNNGTTTCATTTLQYGSANIC